MAAQTYATLDFTPTFLDDLTNGKEFKQAERKAFLRALKLLDVNEKHPSLRVHELERELKGTWSVSASDSLRMSFVRTGNGRKTMLTCSHHYE